MIKNSLSSVPCWHILRLTVSMTSIFDTNVTHDVELTLFVDKFKVFSYPNQMKERLNIRTIEVTFSLHKTQSRKKNWPFTHHEEYPKLFQVHAKFKTIMFHMKIENQIHEFGTFLVLIRLKRQNRT